MVNERWVAAAFTTDELVAELLLRLKQSPSTDLSRVTTPTAATASWNPIAWGDRKSRSKPSATATIVVGKKQKQQQRSPSTPLSWSGGAGPSSSDGYDESSRQADHYFSDRSVKVRGLTTSINNNKSRKRKIELYQDPEKENKKMWRRVESDINIQQKRRFVLPDLNEIPAYE